MLKVDLITMTMSERMMTSKTADLVRPIIGGVDLRISRASFFIVYNAVMHEFMLYLILSMLYFAF